MNNKILLSTLLALGSMSSFASIDCLGVNVETGEGIEVKVAGNPLKILYRKASWGRSAWFTDVLTSVKERDYFEGQKKSPAHDIKAQLNLDDHSYGRRYNATFVLRETKHYTTKTKNEYKLLCNGAVETYQLD